MRKELTERIIKFSSNVINFTETLSNSIRNRIYTEQIIRSASSMTLNFSETESSESRKDFIHKLSVTLKETKETKSNLKLIKNTNQYIDHSILHSLIDESDQLCAIFSKSIYTAKMNSRK